MSGNLLIEWLIVEPCDIRLHNLIQYPIIDSDMNNTTDKNENKNVPSKKRFSLQLAPQVDEMLRLLGAQTGLKYVTIISNGIKSEWVRLGGVTEEKKK